MSPIVQQWINALPPAKQEIILTLRDVLLNADKGLTEKIKWKPYHFARQTKYSVYVLV